MARTNGNMSVGFFGRSLTGGKRLRISSTGLVRTAPVYISPLRVSLFRCAGLFMASPLPVAKRYPPEKGRHPAEPLAIAPHSRVAVGPGHYFANSSGRIVPPPNGN